MRPWGLLQPALKLVNGATKKSRPLHWYQNIKRQDTQRLAIKGQRHLPDALPLAQWRQKRIRALRRHQHITGFAARDGHQDRQWAAECGKLSGAFPNTGLDGGFIGIKKFDLIKVLKRPV